jgi:DNA polymerase III alpha subunit
MDSLIAVCGINCEECGAYRAMLTDDDSLRAATAEVWQKRYGIEYIAIEEVNCAACRVDGVKFQHCITCAVRNCATEQGYSLCSDCPQFKTCQTLAEIYESMPDALKNLKENK